MYQIISKGKSDGFNSLMSGITFLEIGKEVRFEISSSNNEYPTLEIAFKIVRDLTEKEFETSITDIVDGKMDVIFNNPNATTSGPVTPVPILHNETHNFYMMFRVETLKNNTYCQLCYEFIVQTIKQ